MKTLLHMDRVLLCCLLCFVTISLLSVYAAVHQGDIHIWQKQVRFWLFGLLLFFGLIFIPLRHIALMTWVIYILSLLCLMLVPLIGEVQMGARRWIDLGFFNLQPSELVKWSMMLMLAYWFASREARSLQSVSVALLFALVPAGFIVIQPDLGTALVLLLTAAVIIITAGFPWRWLLGIVLSSPLFLYLLWQNMQIYQKKRVLTLLDPQSDPLGSGYHVLQSLIAIGSGGVFGKGYLAGTQSRLHFLPEQHTDFIFAVLAEEGGLIATVLLLLLYTVLIGRILYISSIAYSRFASLVCIGVAAIYTLYVFINIGMVAGILPVVGVPLPFISYGGSSLITVILALALVMRISIESKDKIAWQRPSNPLS